MCLFIAALGCGDKSNARVKGKVTLDGTPLDNGSIRFIPTAGNGPTAGGTIDGGEYSVDKVPATSMRVEITASTGGPTQPYDTANPPKIVVTKQLIPARYNTKSKLTRDVQRGENTFNFELSSK
jgi:hypothetical protein